MSEPNSSPTPAALALPDYRTRSGQERMILAQLHKTPFVTDWWATANPKRAAAWERLRKRRVIIPMPAEKQPQYPFSGFTIQPHG
jgi:hypothetical protein